MSESHLGSRRADRPVGHWHDPPIALSQEAAKLGLAKPERPMMSMKDTDGRRPAGADDEPRETAKRGRPENGATELLIGEGDVRRRAGERD
jgi:hypothetical protein